MGINSGGICAALGDKKALYDRTFKIYGNTMVGKVSQFLDGPKTPRREVRAMVVA